LGGFFSRKKKEAKKEKEREKNRDVNGKTGKKKGNTGKRLETRVYIYIYTK